MIQELCLRYERFVAAIVRAASLFPHMLREVRMYLCISESVETLSA